MRSSNIKGHGATNGPSCHQTNLQVLTLGYFQFICWPKESHRSEQTVQVVAKTMNCSSKTDNKTAFMKTTPTKLIELGEVELVTMHNLHHHPVTLV